MGVVGKDASPPCHQKKRIRRTQKLRKRGRQPVRKIRSTPELRLRGNTNFATATHCIGAVQYTQQQLLERAVAPHRTALVHAAVASELVGTCKAPRAVLVLARKGAFARVRTHVRGQVIRAREAALACFTLEGLLPSVLPLVAHELVRTCKVLEGGKSENTVKGGTRSEASVAAGMLPMLRMSQSAQPVQTSRTFGVPCDNWRSRM